MHITTLAGTVKALVALPQFSATVYRTLNSLLYAEPGFSDVQGDDLAVEMGETPQAIGGAIRELIRVGLVFAEETDVNLINRTFLHTYAHDEGLIHNGNLRPNPMLDMPREERLFQHILGRWAQTDQDAGGDLSAADFLQEVSDLFTTYLEEI